MIHTNTAQLQPVKRGDERLMLKVACVKEERRGGALMAWWNGRGAARVVAHDDPALLMERGGGDLTALPDDQATRIICQTARQLHGLPDRPPGLVPLDCWFRSLMETTAVGFFAAARAIAAELLVAQAPPRVLHGDLHHANILRFADGWKAIDPKGLWGDPAFDHANLFMNPDADLAQANFDDRLVVVCAESGIAPDRMLRWIVAWAGLSALWSIEDGDGDPHATLAMGERALARLSCSNVS